MVAETSERLLKEVGKVVVGRERETRLVLVAFLARGHVLLEGVPGISKTLLARAFSSCLGLEFKRVQFTPDMMPLDIVGGFVFNLKNREFDFRRGPIFSNVLLADEINRAPPKVQSALLEGMQECQVTIEGHTELLPSPFMVVATENPFEFHGVYPLPEGQLDRFMLRVVFDYPDGLVESEILKRNLRDIDLSPIEPIMSNEQIAEVFSKVKSVRVSDEILDYLSSLAKLTRTEERVNLGASPRAMVHLVQAARAFAFLDGRDYVIPDDVKALAVPVLAHRISIEQSAILKGSAPDATAIIREIMEKVKPPR
ncbi:MAG: MoxR family ATPase [Nitrososphaerales archaeon]